MIPDFPSRTRAGILLVAFALVGGTGCITMYTMDRIERSRNERQLAREREAERQQRIAALAARVQAGDQARAVELAQVLLSARDPNKKEVARALAVLAGAAEQGNGPAQALLGAFLVSDPHGLGTLAALPGKRDRARGIALLQKAATQACMFKYDQDFIYDERFDIADKVSSELETDHRVEEARLWRARDIVHCNGTRARYLYFNVLNAKGAQQQAAHLAMLMLTNSQPDIDAARADLAPDTVLAAERETAALRERLAASEREYPAPTRKEMQ